MEEIGREFEKLIIGGNCRIPQPENEEQVDLIELDDENTKEEFQTEESGETLHDGQVRFSPSEIEEAQLVIDENPPDIFSEPNEVDIENGYNDNCENIEIGESTSDSIQIFVSDETPNENTEPPDFDNISTEVQEYYPTNESESHAIEVDHSELPIELFSNNDNVSIVDENNANTDGNIKPERSKKTKTVTFKEDIEEHLMRKPRVRRWRQTKLKLKVEEGCQDVIENLPTLPDTVEVSSSPEKSPRRSPKKESPIYEHRKPGRPRTKPEPQSKVTENGLTRYKVKSAEWKAIELFKCGVCGKVLSCRGSFERHSRMHQDAKPYKCSYCPKTFREACKKVISFILPKCAQPNTTLSGSQQDIIGISKGGT